MEYLNRHPLVLLFFIVVLSSLLVEPLGDFPINDDFQYAYPVKSLIENNSYELIDIIAPNIFTQVGWGYAVCWLVGDFSFSWLRLSTLGAAFLGLCFFYRILLELRVSKNLAFCGTLLLWFQPMYFNLSFSFMTDVPFISLCLATFYCYLLHQKRQNSNYRYIGHLLVLAAFMLRQPGLLLLLCYEGILFIFANKNKKTVLHFLGAILLAFGFYWWVEKGLKVSLGIEKHYLSVGSAYFDLLLYQPLFFCFQVTKRLFLSGLYMGLLTLPLIGFVLKKAKQNHWLSLPKLFVVLLVNIVIMWGFGQLDYHYPYSGNMMYNLGLGAILLPDAFSNNLTHWLTDKPEIPALIWLPFGLLCQVNAFYLFAYLGREFYDYGKDKVIKNNWSVEAKWFLLILTFSFLYLVAMSILSFFDRYLLLPFAVLLIFLMTKIDLSTFKKGAFYFIFALFTFYAIAGTKDYLNILKTAHHAYTDLLEQGVSSSDIDGDMAVNGFHYSPLRNTKAAYKITMGELGEHETVATYPYFRWLSLQRDSIFILKTSSNYQK